jgi:MYXO-CTERM domain-containing protein
MNIQNENGNPGDNMASPKPQAADCDSGCSCHATGKPGKTRWVIGAIVLVAAGVLVARDIIKGDAASAQTTTPAFALPIIATNSSAAAPTTEKSVEPIGTLSELNTVATNLDAIFVFLPGKEGTSANSPSTPMKNATRTIEAQGKKIGLFTLKAGSPDYDQIAGQISLPAVLAMVKGRGMNAISGDITETKLVQGYLAASSAGGCCGAGSSGCGPKK